MRHSFDGRKVINVIHERQDEHSLQKLYQIIFLHLLLLALYSDTFRTWWNKRDIINWGNYRRINHETIMIECVRIDWQLSWRTVNIREGRIHIWLYVCYRTAIRKIRRRIAILTQCVRWSGKNMRHSFDGRKVINVIHERQGGAKDVHHTGEGHVGLPSMGNCSEEQASSLHWKFVSTKGTLSSILWLPSLTGKTSEEKHIGRMCSQIMWCCVQGRNTCWRWNCRSGGMPWRGMKV